MSEVFISYAHSAARQARGAAEALRALGYSVWLDDDLPAHRAFSAEIEQQLAAAKAALVIWSAEAAKSHWVLSEANRAREADKLVQLTIDGARLPMPFDQIQCADLSGWSGEGGHPAWSKVAASVAHLVRRDGGQHAAPAAVPAPAAAAEPLLAVLAFDNLSGDPDVTYFSDGVSEEIQQTIARGADLKVIGRTSSFHYRGSDKAVRRVSAELKATHVLDGAVRRSGPRVRISAQLIECARETTLWSERFDGELTDVFALQDEIAASVAAALKVVFAPAAKAVPVDPAAYELYLKATELLTGSFADPAAWQAALGLLERATTLAPNFARAWAALAMARMSLLRTHGTDEPFPAMRAKAIKAAETALSLDPRSGAASLALAGFEPLARYAERERLIGTALSRSPNDLDLISAAAGFYGRVGRFRDALAVATQGFDLDPMNMSVANGYAVLLAEAGRYPESRELLDRLIDIWPQAPILLNNAIGFAGSAHDWDRIEALVELAKARGLYGDRVRQFADFARNLRARDAGYAARFLRHAREELSRTGNVREILFANLCQIGWVDEAFELIEQASFDYVTDPEKPHLGTFNASYILSPALSSELLRDPRFPGLCAKLRLCDYWVSTDRWPDLAGEDVTPYDFKAACRRLAASD